MSENVRTFLVATVMLLTIEVTAQAQLMFSTEVPTAGHLHGNGPRTAQQSAPIALVAGSHTTSKRCTISDQALYNFMNKNNIDPVGDIK